MMNPALKQAKGLRERDVREDEVEFIQAENRGRT
jgi:hypothetical protein